MSAALQRAESWQERRSRPPRPIKGQRLLRRLHLTQRDVARDLDLSDGVISLLFRRGMWPRNRDQVQARIAALLRRHGADEEDVRVAFDDDDGLFEPRTTRQGSPRLGEAAAPIADEDQLPETEMLSQQAKRHFTLFRDPFQDDIQTADDVFLSEQHRYVREAMFSTARHGGFLAVVGESGAGKTVLRRDLIDRIQREDHPITPIVPRTIDKGRLTAAAICDAVIADVSQERPRRSLEAKARQIERLLTGSSRAGNQHVLIIEEAHDLSVPTLKYLKRFWELEDGFRKLLAIILIGQPELRGKLNERQNWEAREVIRRCEVAELEPLGEGLEEYLRLKFRRHEKPLDQVFGDGAIDAMRSRLRLKARGSGQAIHMDYPLVVNNLAVRAMNLAADAGEPRVTAEVIQGL